MLYVDVRWRGNHGIGRFAREVTARLPKGWSPLRADGSPWSSFDVIRGGRLHLRSKDVIYSPGYNAGPTRARQLLTVHDLMHLGAPGESSAAKRAYYEAFVKPAIRRAGVVMTVSKSSQYAIEDWLGDASVQVRVVGNGISPAFRVGGPVDPRAEGSYMFVGSLKPHKNFDLILRLLAVRPDLRVVAVVTDPVEVASRVWDAGLGARVEVLHALTDEELAALYRGSLGLLFPTKSEGFGLPALEAIACGRPVAYWEGVPPVAEVVGTSGTAFDDAGDPESLADAIDRLPAIRDVQPSEEWLSQFHWDSVSARVAQVIASADEDKHG